MGQGAGAGAQFFFTLLGASTGRMKIKVQTYKAHSAVAAALVTWAAACGLI